MHVHDLTCTCTHIYMKLHVRRVDRWPCWRSDNGSRGSWSDFGGCRLHVHTHACVHIDE